MSTLILCGDSSSAVSFSPSPCTNLSIICISALCLRLTSDIAPEEWRPIGLPTAHQLVPRYGQLLDDGRLTKVHLELARYRAEVVTVEDFLLGALDGP